MSLSNRPKLELLSGDKGVYTDETGVCFWTFHSLGLEDAAQLVESLYCSFK